MLTSFELNSDEMDAFSALQKACVSAYDMINSAREKGLTRLAHWIYMHTICGYSEGLRMPVAFTG